MTNADRPARSGVLAQVLTLIGGTLLAQGIAFVAQIGIARLYTDTDLGYLGIFTSAATLGAAVAGARFDLSIVLPAPGDEASARDVGEGSAPSKAQRDNDPPPIDLLRRGVSDGTVLDPGLNRLDESVSTARGERLGVGQPLRHGSGVHADQGDADGNGAGQRAAPNLVHASNNAPVRGKRALKLARRGGHEGLGTEEKTSGCPTFVLQ